MRIPKPLPETVAAGALVLAGAAPALAAPPAAAQPAAVAVASPEPRPTEGEALPVIGLPVILACVGTVGLSAYQAYKGGDPVEYVASAIIGCIPFGAAAKGPVVKLISENRYTIANVLRGLGATALAGALSGDTAQ